MIARSLTSSSGPPKLKRDLGFARAFFFSLVARVLGDSAVSSSATSFAPFSDSCARDRWDTLDFVLLKTTGVSLISIGRGCEVASASIAESRQLAGNHAGVRDDTATGHICCMAFPPLPSNVTRLRATIPLHFNF
jgi:hypothetical protein